MFSSLGQPLAWELMFDKVSGVLPYAAVVGFLWNVARQGGWRDLVIRILASMMILIIGWWVLVFGAFGLFFAAVGVAYH